MRRFIGILRGLFRSISSKKQEPTLKQVSAPEKIIVF